MAIQNENTDAFTAILNAVKSITDADQKAELLRSILSNTDSNGTTLLMLATKPGKSASLNAIFDSVKSITDDNQKVELLQAMLGPDDNGDTLLTLAARQGKKQLPSTLFSTL